MKKTHLLSILLVSLFFISSCGSDNENDLVGTWEMTFVQLVNCDDPDEDVTFDLSNGPCFMEMGIEVCAEITYTITESEVTIFSEFSSLGFTETNTETASYTVNGNIITACDDDGCDSVTYDINGNDLEMTWVDEDGCEVLVRGRRV